MDRDRARQWEKVVTVSSPGQEEVQIPIGTHKFRLCVEVPAPSPDQNWARRRAARGARAVGSRSHSNDILNFHIGEPVSGTGPSYAAVNENDTEETETDETKFTAFNASVAPIDICVGGEHVI